MNKKQIAVFWSHVEVGAVDDCWEWQASLSKRGYGQGWNGKKPCQAHRLSWEITHGPIPEGVFICHRCDNRKCVNPDHLFLGDVKANAEDAVAKGRTKRWPTKGKVRGEKVNTARLTAADVEEARRLWKYPEWSVGALSEKYGVSDVAMHASLTGKTWAHVEGAHSSVPAVHPWTKRKAGPNSRAMLTMEQAREIRARWQGRGKGISQYALAAEYGVNRSTVLNILRGVVYKE